MNQVLEQIAKIGIVPVIALQDAKDAEPLAKALCDGGLPCAEVTFRTDAAAESLRKMTAAFPQMLIGAGTVLTTEQAKRATAAGAKFIVSPGFNPEVVSFCIDRQIPVLPGCATPSEVEQAIGFGLDAVKFFPAEAAGGIAMIKAMAAPYHRMKFMPTGGISPKNLREYLDFDKILACGGSWMVSTELIKAGDFDRITALTKEAVNMMLGFELKHIGINTPDEKAAHSLADIFGNLLGWEKQEQSNSFFAGSGLEIMKSPYLGANGHIAIGSADVERAVYHLENRGFTFNWETAKYNDRGKLTVLYLKNDFGGFAVHLLQK